MSIAFIDPHLLKPHEDINKINAFCLLFQIYWKGYFTKPILIDQKTKTVLDGHHRCWVAKKLKFKKVPCIMINYLQDSSIEVAPRRSEIPIDKYIVIQTAIQNKVFPQKTTRHTYILPPFTPIPLKYLW